MIECVVLRRSRVIRPDKDTKSRSRFHLLLYSEVIVSVPLLRPQQGNLFEGKVKVRDAPVMIDIWKTHSWVPVLCIEVFQRVKNILSQIEDYLTDKDKGKENGKESLSLKDEAIVSAIESIKIMIEIHPL